MPNVDGGSLWELVERRAAATPDGLAAVDEDGRTLTWAEAKTEAERAAAGLARHGIGAGDVVSWQLPDVAREQGARARAGAPRRHPEPDAPDLPRARGRLHHPAGQEQAARRAVDLVGLRLRGDGQGHRRRDRGRAAARSRCSWPTRPCRRATRPRSRRRPDPSAGHGPLVLLHVGHHGRPEGRAAHRPHDQGQRRRACASGSRSPTPTQRGACSRSPTSAASAGCSARSCTGSPPCTSSASTRPRRSR